MKKQYWAVIILLAAAATAATIWYVKQPAFDLGFIVIHHVDKSKSPAPVSDWEKFNCSNEPELSAQCAKLANPDFNQGLTSSVTNGWKTYTNSKFGLEFKYPQDGQLTEHDLSNEAPYGDGPFCPQKRDLPGCLDLTIKFFNGTEIDYIFQTHKMGSDLGEIVKTEQITVQGKKYDLFIDAHGNAAIHFGQETSIFIFRYPQSPDLKVFKQILSTFKFIK